jgi:hypothetical protein
MRDGEATPLMNGSLMNSPPTPEGPGSVSAAPHLPDGFAGTFTSRYVEAGGLRQHVVTGGDGPPAYITRFDGVRVPAPDHSAALVPADRRAARWHPLRRALRDQRSRVKVRWGTVHSRKATSRMEDVASGLVGPGSLAIDHTPHRAPAHRPGVGPVQVRIVANGRTYALGPAVRNGILCALTWPAALTMGYAATCRLACIFR